MVGGIAAVGERRDTVRLKQAALCARRSVDCRYVDNQDLEPAMQAHDSLHYGKQGKLELGRRMADALIELEGAAAAAEPSMGRGHVTSSGAGTAINSTEKFDAHELQRTRYFE